VRQYTGLDDKTLDLLEKVDVASLGEANLDFAGVQFMFLPDEPQRPEAPFDAVRWTAAANRIASFQTAEVEGPVDEGASLRRRARVAWVARRGPNLCHPVAVAPGLAISLWFWMFTSRDSESQVPGGRKLPPRMRLGGLWPAYGPDLGRSVGPRLNARQGPLHGLCGPAVRAGPHALAPSAAEPVARGPAFPRPAPPRSSGTQVAAPATAVRSSAREGPGSE
jgi:hypothetical protein